MDECCSQSYKSNNFVYVLKRKCHVDEIFAPVCTGNCQNDDISLSVCGVWFKFDFYHSLPRRNFTWQRNYLGRQASCFVIYHFDGLVQHCSISNANALEILQSCTKPSIYSLGNVPGIWCGVCVRTQQSAHHCSGQYPGVHLGPWHAPHPRVV